MIRRPILTIAATSFLVSLSLFVGIMTNHNVQASLFGHSVPVAQGFILPALTQVEDATVASELSDTNIIAKSGDWSFCSYELPEEATYNVDMISSSIEENIQGGELFYVEFIYENTGNTRLFSEGSECDNAAILNLGTQMEQDRNSRFGSEENGVSGWLSETRIKMVESYVDPGEEFKIAFQSVAPEGDNIHREFFQPLVEDHGWIDEAFALDIVVGEPTEAMYDDIQFVTRLAIDAASLSGLERNLEVDLSEQLMYAKFGDIAVWAMQTSTGAWDTPTPTGSYEIFQKQELRIGGTAPHYRMPYWQYWRSDGYGIHALPYLGADDGGYFWSEALEHIGTPVSHGCIRTLPEDAETVYLFTDIGTPIVIHD